MPFFSPDVSSLAQNPSCIRESCLGDVKFLLMRKNIHPGFRESLPGGGGFLLTKQNLHPRFRLHSITCFRFQSEAQHLTEYGHQLVEFLHKEAAMVSRWISGETLDNVSFPPIDIKVSAFVGGMTSYFLMSNSIFNKGERMRYLNSIGKSLDALAEEEKDENWLLIMNPTPFNRFVLMRCQSIEFEEEVDDAYEKGIVSKLVIEGRHFVKLRTTDMVDAGSNKGKSIDDDDEQDGFISRLASKFAITSQQNLKRNKNLGQVPKSNTDSGRVSSPTFSRNSKQNPGLVNGVLSGYQRRYIHTVDGGVLAIDWPSHLDLSGENALDTTFVLIAGTAEGSGNRRIKSFVQRSVRCGYFPIVMNPRGCGGSPLITPRMFTAGDSNDVQIVVDFISRSRPCTTIMAIGWGYGANMLAKYLGEEELATPVTAAVCINNPFDLEESTNASSDTRAIDFDRDMTNGFVQILKENQMVFEGRTNQFDTRKGLSATAVREFDEAISMVSNGFDDVHAFYEYSSSRSWIDNVKVPVLCIQDDDAIGKSFLVPQHVFERNAYTTLILSLRKMWKLKGDVYQQEMSRIQHDSMIIEWLAAVELAFLKGRHPLLEGIDVTYKAPKGWGLFRQSLSTFTNQVSQMRSRRKHITEDISHRNVDKEASDWDLDVLEEDKMQEIDLKNVHGLSAVENAEEDPDVERGQLERAAESVLNALDITMPGSLSEKQKEEVLEAVGRGETIASALQAACPEDVRAKMITAVSAAVQARGISLKRAGFGESISVPSISGSTIKEIQQKVSSVNDRITAPLTNQLRGESQSNVSKESDIMVHGSGNESSGHSEVSVKSPQSIESSEGHDYTAITKSTFQNWNGFNNKEALSQSTNLQQGQSVNSLDVQKNEQETGNGALSAQNESSSEADYEVPLSNSSDVQLNDQEIDVGNTHRDDETKQVEFIQMKQMSGGERQSQEDGMKVDEIKETEYQPEEKNQSLPKPDLEVNYRKSPGQNSEDIVSQVTAQKSISTSIDVRQALLAFTEVDDSTQMAVTNVFEVIGNVIDQLEREQEKDKQNQDENEESKEKDKQNQGENHKPEIQESENLPQVLSREELAKEQNTENECQKQTGRTLHNKHDQVCAPDDIDCDEDLNNKGFEDSKKYLHRKIIPGTYSSFSNRGRVPMCAQKSIVRGISDRHTVHPLILNKYYGILSDGKVAQKEFIIANKPISIPDDVALEYFEDEKIWKFISNASDSSDDDDEVHDKTDRKRRVEREHESEDYGKLKSDTGRTTNGILAETFEPDYIIMDDEKHVSGNGSCVHNSTYDDENADSEEYIEELRDEENCMRDTPLKEKIKDAIVDTVRHDLLRRFGDAEMKMLGDGLNEDIEMIGLTVAEETNLDVVYDQREESSQNWVSQLQGTGQAPKIHVNTVMCAINKVYGGCVILPRLMPVGVLFGLVLAALNPLDILSTDDVNGDEHTDNEQSTLEKTNPEGKFINPSINNNEESNRKAGQDLQENEQDQIMLHEQNLDTTCQMMNLTAGAMGDTTTFATEKSGCENSEPEREEFISTHSTKSTHPVETPAKNEDLKRESDEGKLGIVSAFAEKAMFVASPVVPIKEDGEVDHDRLVVVLAGLVQKGGIWRYIGKMALLWGGLRGAISLTDKLLGFLHMSDRPLHQRLPGFVVMALLLWSPVFVPLLPTLLQQWAKESYNSIASMAALVGLYGAVVILVAIWGRKIRGYDDPFVEYGIKLQPTLGQLQSLASGFVFGLSPIISIHLLSIFCGFTRFSWDCSLCISGSQSWLSNILSSLRMLKVVLQCLGTSLLISFLKELIFRSWLQDEISVDLGFHKAVIFSGFAFAVCHWCIPVIPSLWLLSLALSAVKVKCNGNLVPVIGFHAGLIAGNQFMNQAGKLKYAADAPIWIVGTQPGNPLTGLVGVFVLCVLVLSLYPWDYKLQRTNEFTTL